MYENYFGLYYFFAKSTFEIQFRLLMSIEEAFRSNNIPILRKDKNLCCKLKLEKEIDLVKNLASVEPE